MSRHTPEFGLRNVFAALRMRMRRVLRHSLGRISFSAAAAGLYLLSMSLAAADPDPPSLWDSIDPELQSAVEQTLRALHPEYGRAIRNKQLALVVVDVTDWEKPRVASINGDEMMYAASLPKIAIVLGAFVMIERGEMTLDDETRKQLTRTIRNSSNRDATALIRRVGIENLAEILQSDRFRLYDPAHNGGLWVGKEYGKGAAWKRDPLHNLSHGATAMQAARFYYLVGSGQAFSPELTAEIDEIFSKPAIRHKFVKGLHGRSKTDIFRKSGTWRHWHADSGLIEDEDNAYIAVALADHPEGAEGLAELIGAIDDLMEKRQAAKKQPSK